MTECNCKCHTPDGPYRTAVSAVKNKIRHIPKVERHHLGIAWFTVLVAAANAYLLLGPPGPLSALAVLIDILFFGTMTVLSIASVISHYDR